MKNEPRRDYSGLIEQVLAPYGVWPAGDGKYRSACPIHKGDNATTFSIFSNGRWRCFKCSAWGDMARLLVAVRHLSLKQAQEYIGSSPVPFRRMEDIATLPAKRELKPRVPYEVLQDSLLAPYKKHCPEYLIGRGFSEASLQRFEIGYDLGNSKIVIPVRDSKSRLVGLTYRLDFDTDRSQPAKYWHDNFSKSLHLYGFHLWARRKLRRFYVVEGQLDAVRMYQLGYAAAAVMGSEISHEQVDVLLRDCQADRIVLAFDNDDAGSKARRDAIYKLSRTRFARGLLVLNYDTNDPGELNEQHQLTTIPWHFCL